MILEIPLFFVALEAIEEWMVTWDTGMMVENVRECRILNIWSDLTRPTGWQAPVTLGRGAGLTSQCIAMISILCSKNDSEPSTISEMFMKLYRCRFLDENGLFALLSNYILQADT